MVTKVKSGVIGDNTVGITQLNVSDGSNGQVLTTNGSGTLSFTTISAGVAGISTSADATAITIDSSENVAFSQNVTVAGDLTVDTNTFHVDSADNAVGVGNTSPNYLLHISKTQTETYSGNGEPDGTSDHGRPTPIVRIENNSATDGSHTTLEFKAEPASGNEARGFIGIESVTGGDDTNMFLGLRVASNAHQTRIHISEHSVEMPLVRASAWWNGSMKAPGDDAVEIGVSGTNGYLIAYDRNNTHYLPLVFDGEYITFGTNSAAGGGGTQQSKWRMGNNGNFYPMSNDVYDVGTGGYEIRRVLSGGTISTSNTSGQPIVSTSGQGNLHISAPVSSTTGITFGLEGNSGNTQAAFTCHNNNSNGTHLGFHTTQSYATGPRCRVKFSNYGTIICGYDQAVHDVTAPTNTAIYSKYGDIYCNASNNDVMLSDELGGYSRGSYSTFKSTGNYIYFTVGSTYASYISSNGSYTSTSDISLKENITTLSGALGKVNQLRGVNFNWKDSERGTGNQIGFIAQEVESVYPEFVDDGGLPADQNGDDAPKTVDYAKMVAVCVEAIKELKTELDAAKARITTLEG
tara:strand:- start:3886 stop:5613 length:1728 start_codon:yes stop_codon:yes gene_type:complete